MSFEVGQKVEVSRTYQPEEAQTFAELSNLDAPFMDRVPEPLIASLFSYLLGVKLPGSGTNYLKQEMQFVGSAPYGEELTASVEITRLRPEKHLVDLETICRRADGTEICRGRALVLAKDTGKM